MMNDISHLSASDRAALGSLLTRMGCTFSSNGTASEVIDNIITFGNAVCDESPVGLLPQPALKPSTCWHWRAGRSGAPQWRELALSSDNETFLQIDMDERAASLWSCGDITVTLFTFTGDTAPEARAEAALREWWGGLEKYLGVAP